MKFKLAILLIAPALLLGACSTASDSSSASESSSSSSSVAPVDHDITYAELLAAYNARQASDYNHREYIYADGVGSLVPYHVYEDLIESIWTVDTSRSEGGVTDSAMEYFYQYYSIPTFEPYIESCTVVCKAKNDGSGYSFHVEADDHGAHVIIDIVYDQYFDVLSSVQKVDGQTSISITEATWSKVSA